MRILRFLCVLFSAIFLFGCTTAPTSNDKPPDPTFPLDVLLYQATAEAKKQQPDFEKVRDFLLRAKKAYPTSPEPWLLEAQLHFEAAEYGEAIIAAQEAIKLDPADRQAHSIRVVAGLRIATESLATLRRANNVSGSLRADTVRLAKSLQDSLGVGTLVPPPHNRNVSTPVQKPRPTQKVKPIPPSGQSSNPFDPLK